MRFLDILGGVLFGSVLYRIMLMFVCITIKYLS